LFVFVVIIADEEVSKKFQISRNEKKVAKNGFAEAHLRLCEPVFCEGLTIFSLTAILHVNKRTYLRGRVKFPTGGENPRASAHADFVSFILIDESGARLNQNIRSTILTRSMTRRNSGVDGTVRMKEGIRSGGFRLEPARPETTAFRAFFSAVLPASAPMNCASGYFLC
jgi:hypothetical protein